METLGDKYGYDDDLFVSEAPDYVHCILCSLVLRDPIQFLRCGHKLCSACFNRMKSSAENNNTELLCPVDRDVVSMNDVREDVAVKRLVGNLLARCSQHNAGCAWTGDLRDLDAHIRQCQYQPKQPCNATAQLSADYIMKINNRLDKYETSLLDKDKEIALLKHEQQHLKEKVSGMLEKQQQQQQQQHETLLEVNALKKTNQTLERKVLELEQQQHEALHEVAAFKKKNDGLEQMVLQVEKQQTRINTLIFDVETLQKELAKCYQKDQAVLFDSTKFITEDKGLAANPSKTVPSDDAEKEPLVEKKKILIQHHNGLPDDATISADNSHIKFDGELFVTVSAPFAKVPKGRKAWYEVECTRLQEAETQHYGWISVGWAKDSLPMTEDYYDLQIGSWKKHSYGFKPFSLTDKSHLRRKWEKQGPKILGCSGVVGIALDLHKCEVLFSINGKWGIPNGLRLTGIPTDAKLFPAISGWKSEVCVNFGDKSFQIWTSRLIF